MPPTPETSHLIQDGQSDATIELAAITAPVNDSGDIVSGPHIEGVEREYDKTPLQQAVEEGLLGSDVRRDVSTRPAETHPEGVGQQYDNTSLQEAVRTGLLGSHVRKAITEADQIPADSVSLEGTNQSRNRTPLYIGLGVAGTLALGAGIGYGFANSGEDAPSAGPATPETPAAAVSTANIPTNGDTVNPEAGTVTIPQPAEATVAPSTESRQVVPEVQDPVEAFLEKGVVAGSGGIAITEADLLPGGEMLAGYHIRGEEYTTPIIPDPSVASAEQLAVRELALLSGYYSTDNEADASALLQTMTMNEPLNGFANYLKESRATLQATANTEPDGVMLVTHASNPANPAVFEKTSKVNSNGDTITTVTLVSGELYQQNDFIPGFKSVEEARATPYAASLTLPITEFSLVIQPTTRPDQGWGEFESDLGITYGENIAAQS